MKEDKDRVRRGCTAFRCIDIQLLPRVRAISDRRRGRSIKLGRARCPPVRKIELLGITFVPEP